MNMLKSSGERMSPCERPSDMEKGGELSPLTEMDVVRCEFQLARMETILSGMPIARRTAQSASGWTEGKAFLMSTNSA